MLGRRVLDTGIAGGAGLTESGHAAGVAVGIGQSPTSTPSSRGRPGYRPRMRILLAADLHDALPHVDWIAARAEGFDAVALAGDHLDIVSPVELTTQIAATRTSLAALAGRTQRLIASGNHDLNTRNPAGEKTSDWLAPLRDAGAAVDGDTIEVAGT